MYIHTCIHEHTYMYTCIYTNIYTLYMHMHMYTYFVCMYTHLCMYTLMYTEICIHTLPEACSSPSTSRKKIGFHRCTKQCKILFLTQVCMWKKWEQTLSFHTTNNPHKKNIFTSDCVSHCTRNMYIYVYMHHKCIHVHCS